MISSNNSFNIEVAPRNGSYRREVVAKVGDTAIHYDCLDVRYSAARERFLREAAAKAGMSGDDIVGRWDMRMVQEAERADAAAREEAEKAEQQEDDDVFTAGKEALEDTPPHVIAAAEELLEREDMLLVIGDDIERLGVAGERNLGLLTYIACTSRLLARPIYLLIQGVSSSGKSYVPSRVETLMPPETIVLATDLTTNALYYVGENRLRHRSLLLGERERQSDPERVDATKALRELVETQRLRKLVPMRVGEAIQTIELEIHGPAAVIESISHDLICDEDRNRAIIVTTDETKSQTRRVLATTAEQYRMTVGQDINGVIAKHHALQRLLEPRPVMVPWADALARLFPADRVEARRAFPRVLWVVQAIALLHQRQPGRLQDVDGEEVVVATLHDYVVARELLSSWLRVELGRGISDAARRLWDHATSHQGTFTRREAEEWMGVGRRQAYRWLNELVEVGLLSKHGERGKPSRYEVVQGLTPAGMSLLPTYEELLREIEQTENP